MFGAIMLGACWEPLPFDLQCDLVDFRLMYMHLRRGDSERQLASSSSLHAACGASMMKLLAFSDRSIRSRRGQLRQNACAQHVYISEHAGSEMQRERKIEIIERLEGRLEGDLDRILIIVIIYMGRGRERERYREKRMCVWGGREYILLCPKP